MTLEGIKAIHWVYDNCLGFDYSNFDDFRCAVSQKEAELLGYK